MKMRNDIRQGTIACYLILLAISLFFASLGYGDIIYLKNGRHIEGIIKNEDKENVELEVNAGSVKFKRSEIERIEHSRAPEEQGLRQRWNEERVQTQARIEQQRKTEESRPKSVEFSGDARSIIVRATLNNRVEASLVLDTGASLIMLRKSVARELGINPERLKPDMQVTLADGRKVEAKHIVLDSVKVEKSEAKNVEATVILEEGPGLGSYDGLLGMSFLGKFNFKIDHKEKKIVLEKL
jgi:clan AA aspartic protease (TIGR02281 family)